ncbi:MAG: SCP2 sterol-binding domain-containing protein [Meiothermus sp.]|nr:SCP2 sterol-binding domain-containing protein [Meiothermus sp.]
MNPRTPRTPQSQHPTVLRLASRGPQPQAPAVLEAEALRQLCLECGADDVGFVSLERPELAESRQEVLWTFPAARSVIVFVCRMNREPIRSPARSLANTEFHQVGDHVTQTSHLIARRLEELGVRALNEPVAFPMEADRFPKPWTLSLKPLAEAAGLGRMGIHRNVIHPQFGNFILLGAVVLDRPISCENQPLDYNPCLECKLCVAACPVGAIGPDGHFNFNSCYTHNYREFMTGFHDWVDQLADSRSAADYRKKVDVTETLSMWQSLSGGPNYKAAYCMAVCPAGEDVIAPFLEDRKGFLAQQVWPLQKKTETVYVVAGTDAEAYTAKRFPHKRLKRVKNGLRVGSVMAFATNLVHLFQREQSKGLKARYHFRFGGDEKLELTVGIADKKIEVQQGCLGTADLEVSADSRAWVRVLSGELSMVAALLTRRVQLKGPLRLLVAFGKCFPTT